ncbi:MAG TPA: DotU family type IV/VI secretion system protein [Bryobacteraceae bacterium]|jgi:type VI secretion system protein ImpK|nr:DotU family type IV/VI secretion system protein [Bryobacteraceae bacterium]
MARPQAPAPPQPGASPYAQESLALLYQGFFTGIVRIQSGRQQIANADGFRRRMVEALAEVNRESIKRNYAREHTIETDFAIVAFLDEVILSSHDPCRDEWAQKPLQDELFGISVAGELFYARLEKLLTRQDSPELADMLEVFYLCLLLGFKGKYIIGGGSELHVLMDRVGQRIERIRGSRPLLSPNGGIPGEVIAAAAPDTLANTLLRTGIGSVGLSVVLFLLFLLLLVFKGSNVRDAIAKSLT